MKISDLAVQINQYGRRCRRNGCSCLLNDDCAIAVCYCKDGRDLTKTIDGVNLKDHINSCGTLCLSV